MFYETTSGGSNLKDILENSIKVSETSSAGGDGENAASGELKLKLEVGTNRSITFFVFITSIGRKERQGEESAKKNSVVGGCGSAIFLVGFVFGVLINQILRLVFGW